MKKRLLVLLLSVLTLVAFTGCGSEPKPLTEEEKKALLSESFSSAPFFEGKESATLLTNDEVKAVISAAPSDKYEVYPDTHNLPANAALISLISALSFWIIFGARVIAAMSFIDIAGDPITYLDEPSSD